MDLKEKKLSVLSEPTQSEEKRVRTTENDEPEPKKCCISTEKMILIGIIAAILAIIPILVLCLTLIKKDKKKEENEEDALLKANKERYILGTYNMQKGIPLKIFNPSSLGLDSQSYRIEEVSSGKTRRLREVAVHDGVIIPEETGTIQIKISFNTPLTSLDFMFERCTDLVKINLTNINSPSITSMIYTFTDCINLQVVDMTSFPSAHIKKMDFLFSGCINLTNIKGFETLDTSSLVKTIGMFLDCQNLISVNLSSFYLDNISESSGMFINNPSLELLDLGNVTDINGLFSSTEFFKVSIVVKSSIQVNYSCLSGVFSIISRAANRRLNCSLRNWTDFVMKHIDLGYINRFLPKNFTEVIKKYENYYFGKNLYDELMKIKYIDCNSFNNTFLYFNYSECEKYKRFYIDFLTENEKCMECDDEEGRSMYCKKCAIGYYLPKSNDYLPTRCRRCDEGCLECVADDETDKSICLKCKENNLDESNYEFDAEYDNKSEYKLYNGKCIKKCEIGLDEKCQSCNEGDGKYDECLTCNDGYYFDIDYNKGFCKKIEIENCIQAIKDSNIVNCVQCIDGYLAHNGQCEKGCNLGENGNTCASCNLTYEFKDNCASCHPGFYLKPNGDTASCSNCSADTPEDNKCSECVYNSVELTCTSCDSRRFLSDGKCLISCTENCLNCVNKNEKMICDTCKDKYYLETMDGGKICKKCPDECTKCSGKNNCTECLEEYKLINGICEKYCTIGTNSQCKSCDFDEKNKCKDCNSGYYLPTSNLLGRSYCYDCGQHCISCHGDGDSPICTHCIEGFFVSNSGSCNSCGSPRIKKCHQGNDSNIIVDECYYDYVPFKDSCIEKCNINNYQSKCSVCNEESDKLYQCKECREGYYLPNNLDNIYCYNCPNNCKSCEGSNDAPICTSCYEDYILSGGKCLKNCNTGNNELCKNCNTEQGKIDKCLDCNDGYYLPINNEQKQCSKCPNNCQKCNSIDNINVNCTECDTGYYLARTEVIQYTNYYSNPMFFQACFPCNITGCTQYKPNSNTCICIQCDSDETERIKNGNIDNEYISCYGKCEIGQLDKCKSCGNNIGECGRCNEGYILNSNRKCIFNSHTFHVFAKYKTTRQNEYVYLLYRNEISYMVIDGTVINYPYFYHRFPTPGEHLVYMQFYIGIDFACLFKGIAHLTYIEFLPAAEFIYKYNELFFWWVH